MDSGLLICKPAGTQTSSHGSGGILKWISAHKITSLIVVGVVADWLPSYFFSLPNGAVSGTRLLVIPLILLDIVRAPYSYLALNYAWLYAFGLAAIGAYGLLSGRTGSVDLTSYLPNLLILMFFLKPRTSSDLRRILSLAVIASFLVPMSLLLAWTGVLTPKVVVIESEFSRLLAGTNWSSLGLYFALIFASLGGWLLLEDPPVHRNRVVPVAVVVALILSFWAVLLPAQRSSLIVCVVCFGISLVSLLALTGGKGRFGILAVVFTVVFASALLLPLADETPTASMLYRLSTTEDDQSTQSRLTMYRVFLDDLFNRPALIAADSEQFHMQSGTYPHFVIGEAYYATGGLLFAGIILYGFAVSGIRTVRFGYHAGSPGDKLLAVALTSTYVGYVFNLATHPGLSTRLVYMLLGIWLALDRCGRLPADNAEN